MRQLRLHREGRLEIAPTISFTLLDEYQRTILVGGRLNYNITDWLAIGGWIACGVVQTTTGLTDQHPGSDGRIAARTGAGRRRTERLPDQHLDQQPPHAGEHRDGVQRSARHHQLGHLAADHAGSFPRQARHLPEDLRRHRRLHFRRSGVHRVEGARRLSDRRTASTAPTCRSVPRLAPRSRRRSASVCRSTWATS